MRLAAVSAVLLFQASPVFAVTITVPTDAPTIQAGIDMANDGDTVSVLPGVYYEHIIMDSQDGGITVKSFLPRQAIIDGGGTSRVFTCSDLPTGTAIQDFVIQNGHAEGEGWPDGAGGGILASNCAVSITGNSFTSNDATSEGGAIDVVDGVADVHGNTLDGNTTLVGGAGIHLYGCSGVVEENTISANHAGDGGPRGGGAGIAIGGGATTSILRNRLLNNVADIGPGGIYLADHSSCTIDGNLISGNVGPANGGGILLEDATAVILNNVITFNQSVHFGGGGGVFKGFRATATIVSNTFFRNSASTGAAILVIDSGSADIHHNIIAENGVGDGIVCDGGTLSLQCNDVWGNVPSNYVGCVPGSGDFSEDPLFCGGEDEFHISSASPCVTGFGCGLVGALGVACGPTATEAVTWGGIKARYR